jgi:hypothetical protein
VNSSVVNRELRAVVRPFLQTHGFSAFTPRTAWRYVPGRVEVVNFQSFSATLAEGLGCTSYSFSLRLGIFLVDVPPAQPEGLKQVDGAPRPEEWQCDLRFTPERAIEQPELRRRDIWYVDPNARYLALAARDARRAIAEEGLPWFERWTDEAVLTELLSDSGIRAKDGTTLPGNTGAPLRNYVCGYLALALGRRHVAVERLARALSQFEAMDASNGKISKRFEPRTPAHLRADVQLLTAAV